MKNIMKFLTVIILAGTTLSACADAAVSNLTTVSGNAAAAAQTTKTEQTTQADSSGDVPIPRHDENSTEYESEINAYRYPGDSLEYTLTQTFGIGDYTFRYGDFCKVQEIDKVDGQYTLHGIENSVHHYFDVYYGSTGELDWLDPELKGQMPDELTLTNALDLVLPCMTVNFSDPVHDMSLAGAKNYLDRAMGYSEDSAR
ncbi:MAG: hypothetical protein ACOX78_03620 [Lachnospiraceae bacterium]|jgi:hypothetical protein